MRRSRQLSLLPIKRR
ncbi:hypothetical protein RSOL_430790 [Rhizoctonia solani AG-3 Rhs1AP]|uniref:Uncharacterized protein n=1 Tax=Rhizoctonia solani AG-3 Rhs1AP TaxID=1086054 RepID=X8JJ98_9AGAM|nr:hypothetical protein RSOL_430790 [Rhizoctonia solani AG-3 Rhs1AP]